MPKCQYCGTQLEEGASFCTNCGKPTASPSTIQVTAATGSLLTVSDLVLKKKILSVREHYDLEDRNGTKLGEANGNLIQLPAKFVVTDAGGAQVMRLEGKVISLRKQFTFYDSAGQELGTIKKKIVRLIGEEYWVEKNGVEFMRIYGNFT